MPMSRPADPLGTSRFQGQPFELTRPSQCRWSLDRWLVRCHATLAMARKLQKAHQMAPKRLWRPVGDRSRPGAGLAVRHDGGGLGPCRSSLVVTVVCTRLQAGTRTQQPCETRSSLHGYQTSGPFGSRHVPTASCSARIDAIETLNVFMASPFQLFSFQLSDHFTAWAAVRLRRVTTLPVPQVTECMHQTRVHGYTGLETVVVLRERQTGGTPPPLGPLWALEDMTVTCGCHWLKCSNTVTSAPLSDGTGYRSGVLFGVFARRQRWTCVQETSLGAYAVGVATVPLLPSCTVDGYQLIPMGHAE